MADAFNSTSTLSTLVTTALERRAWFKLRPKLMFSNVASVRPTMLTSPGLTYTWQVWDELAEATAELNELTDPDLVAATKSTFSITIAERGNGALTTKKLRGSTFLAALDQDISNLISWNAALSYDTLHRTPLVAGTNVSYASTATSRATVGAAMTLTSAKVKYIVAKLRANNAQGFDDLGVEGEGVYVAFIHPDVAYDLMEETGNAGWTVPANFSAADRRWNGRLGKFHSVMFLETPRAPFFADAGVGSTVDVYATIFSGAETLGRVYSKPESADAPQFGIAPQIDRFRRHNTYTWYWFGGVGRVREEALFRVESSSSIGTNS